MPIEITCRQARANLKSLLDEVTENREQVIIRRRGGGDVAMIAADELRGLIETTRLAKLRANLGLDDED